MSSVEPSGVEEFGPYLVYERLGVGGMATVHRAKKRGIAGFERIVALKRMLPHLAEDAEFINSFVREAKLASLLVHPNIAQIYDFGRVSEVYFIAMELVDGFDVRRMLRYSNRTKEPLPLPVVLSVLCELCEALEYAHTFVDEHGEHLGIVHRDVSPSNLIVANSGHLKVIDFGIAKAMVRHLRTDTGRIKGKLGYMSPEAVTEREFGPASDVFSAGVVAYELLTAHPLFSARTDYDTLLRIHEAEVPPPSTRNPAVPAALDNIVLAALARNPEHRLQSAKAFREALEYVAECSGMRFSARDVAEWRARIATTDESWGSRPTGRSTSDLRGAQTGSLPRSTSDSGASASFRGRPRERPQTRSTSHPFASVSPSSAEDDRVVAERTWGGEAGGLPSHSLPDQAIAMPAPPQPAQIVALPATAAGSGKRSGAVARTIVIALATVAAGLAVYQFGLRPDRPVAAPTAVLASVKFVVDPRDATIQIGGKIAGHASPFETQLEPGVYSVAVSRDGYKPWQSELTVREADKQTVNVALQVGTAQLSLTSQPPGLPVTLDGKPLDQVTPTEIQITAGPHTVAVTGAGGLAWSHDFTAAVDARLAFNAALGATKRPPGTNTRPSAASDEPRAAATRPSAASDEPRAAATRPSAASDEPRAASNPAPGPTGHAKEPPRPKRIRSPRPGGEQVADGDVRAAEPELEPLPAPKIEAPPPVVPEPIKPPAPPPVAAKHRGKTPVVAITAVTKQSGEIPVLKVNGITDNYADVVSKLCIDEAGRVATATLIKALPEIADELRRALLGWRYKPYVNSAGEPSTACFVLQFRMSFKHAR
jgi:serine/threonine protein kinase